jgi:hypothetical protein
MTRRLVLDPGGQLWLLELAPGMFWQPGSVYVGEHWELVRVDWAELEALGVSC